MRLFRSFPFRLQFSYSRALHQNTAKDTIRPFPQIKTFLPNGPINKRNSSWGSDCIIASVFFIVWHVSSIAYYLFFPHRKVQIMTLPFLLRSIRKDLSRFAVWTNINEEMRLTADNTGPDLYQRRRNGNDRRRTLQRWTASP